MYQFDVREQCKVLFTAEYYYKCLLNGQYSVTVFDYKCRCYSPQKEKSTHKDTDRLDIIIKHIRLHYKGYLITAEFVKSLYIHNLQLYCFLLFIYSNDL